MEASCFYCEVPLDGHASCPSCHLPEAEAWSCRCQGRWLIFGLLCPECRSGVCPYGEYLVQPSAYARPRYESGWGCNRCSRFYTKPPSERATGYCQHCHRLAELYGPAMTRRYWEFIKHLRSEGIMVG